MMSTLLADHGRGGHGVADLGGQIIVAPHDVVPFARISLISDPTGALFGLWQEQRP